MDTPRRTQLYFFLVLTCAIWIAGIASAAAQTNPIQIENAKPGSTDWLLTRVVRHDDEIYELGWHRRKGIEAYTSRTSIKAGERLDVHVSTYPVNQYSVSIYRMGYYGGAGARLMRSLGPLQGTTEPDPKDGDRNLVECKWKVGFSLDIPQDWVSGVYLGKLSTLPAAAGQYLDLEMKSDAYFVFIVRDDRRADLLFQASDMTWLSYNRWPQWRSLYDLGTAPWGASNAKVGYDVGFDRPYRALLERLPRGLPSSDQRLGRIPDDRVPAGLLAGEGGLRRHLHLERRHPRRRARTAARQRSSCRSATTSTGRSRCSTTSSKARDAGVNLAFLSGNAISGVVELRTEHRWPSESCDASSRDADSKASRT